MACSYCYARAMYKRFKWNPKIHLTSRWWSELPHIKPSRIFIGSTMELFGDWIPDEWLKDIFLHCQIESQHTFIFLTKQPQNLSKWSPFPENCWVGVTATDGQEFVDALNNLVHVKAPVQFISFEPLLDWHIESWLIETDLKSQPEIKWLIIGQQTPISAKTQPKIEWIQEIVEAADKAETPVFLKDNLKPLLIRDGGYANAGVELLNRDIEHGTWKLRQEFPL